MMFLASTAWIFVPGALVATIQLGLAASVFVYDTNNITDY